MKAIIRDILTGKIIIPEKEYEALLGFMMTSTWKEVKHAIKSALK